MEINVYYWKDINWLLFFEFNGFGNTVIGEDKPIAFVKKIFEQEWVKLPISFEEDYYNDKIFSILNSDDNPMGNKEKQEWIKNNGLNHTSFSVGDIIQRGTDFYVCLPFGFRKLSWCK